MHGLVTTFVIDIGIGVLDCRDAASGRFHLASLMLVIGTRCRCFISRLKSCADSLELETDKPKHAATSPTERFCVGKILPWKSISL